MRSSFSYPLKIKKKTRKLEISNPSGRDYLKHISSISEQNQKLQKKKIPEMNFPLRPQILKESGVFQGNAKNERSEEKSGKKGKLPSNQSSGSKQQKIEDFMFSATKPKKTAKEKFEEDLQKALEESKKIYEMENQKEIQEINEICQQIKEIEEMQKQESSNSSNKKRRDEENLDIYKSSRISLKKIKNSDYSRENSMTSLKDLEISKEYLELEKKLAQESLK